MQKQMLNNMIMFGNPKQELNQEMFNLNNNMNSNYMNTNNMKPNYNNMNKDSINTS